MSARFSASEAADVDTARGTAGRATWLRAAALAAVERQRPPAAHADRQAQAVTENLAAAQEDCPHPRARVHKGMCHACGKPAGGKR